MSDKEFYVNEYDIYEDDDMIDEYIEDNRYEYRSEWFRYISNCFNYDY